MIDARRYCCGCFSDLHGAACCCCCRWAESRSQLPAHKNPIPSTKRDIETWSQTDFERFLPRFFLELRTQKQGYYHVKTYKLMLASFQRWLNEKREEKVKLLQQGIERDSDGNAIVVPDRIVLTSKDRVELANLRDAISKAMRRYVFFSLSAWPPTCQIARLCVGLVAVAECAWLLPMLLT